MDGSDILEAGSGRDILIGGLGLDILKGDAGDDILIAGRTTNDTNLSNLNTLRAQWISGRRLFNSHHESASRSWQSGGFAESKDQRAERRGRG
jgi:hypothetical protein